MPCLGNKKVPQIVRSFVRLFNVYIWQEHCGGKVRNSVYQTWPSQLLHMGPVCLKSAAMENARPLVHPYAVQGDVSKLWAENHEHNQIHFDNCQKMLDNDLYAYAAYKTKKKSKFIVDFHMSL